MRLFIILIYIIYSLPSFSQDVRRACATHDVLQEQKRLYPKIGDNMERIERHTQAVQSLPQMKIRRGAITIPVIVHVVYRAANPIENITDEQIMSQLEVLNKDYRRLNSDNKMTPSVFTPFSADCELEFKLAKRTPIGKPTTGIIRYSSDRKVTWGKSDEVKMPEKGGITPWDASKYLNLYVCAVGGGVLGYSSMPGSLAAFDGVVIDYRYFGTVGTAVSPFNLGRTTTHEVGHWLNLRHTWGDTDCGDDLVNDTPVQQGPNYGCTAFPHLTCSGDSKGDMFMNFMDYTDDACMTMFSTGQKARIQALFAFGGARESLLNSDVLAPLNENCQAPTALVVKDFESKTVTLAWTAAAGISDYIVEYRAKNIANWLSFSVKNASTTALFDLLPNTEYEYRLKFSCATNTDYTAPISFKTLPFEQECSDVYESNNTFTTAKEMPTNKSISALIGMATDNDFYVFKTTKIENNIQILLSELPFDYDVKLYNSQHQLVGTSTRTDKTEERIVLNNAPVDYYYIRVYPNNDFSATQCYKLIANTSSSNFSRESDKIATEAFKDKTVETLKVYPNPATESVQVEINTVFEGVANIRIEDLTGKTVLIKTQNISKELKAFQIDISNLNDGLYILMVKTGLIIQTKKILVSKDF
jgi:Pregnancy-associated plasma protein-A/Secretion system C-terminal sorting domain/Fibronectin type III domain